MSKQTYEEPKMKVITFQTADIITTSTESFDGEWIPISPTDIEGNDDFLIH